jgi:putative methyltransferase (TIGR04325 family)
MNSPLRAIRKSLRKLNYYLVRFGIESESKIGYELPELVDLVVEKNQVFRKRLGSGAIEFKEADLRILTYLSFIPDRDPMRILDFGGGGGNLEALVSHLLPHRNFTWKVVETESLARAAQNTLQKENIEWITEIPKPETLKVKFDIAIASSSIQYTNNPADTLNQIISLKPSYIILNRTPLLGSEKMQQRYIQQSWLSSNGPGEMPKRFVNKLVKYPICIPRMTEIEALFSENYKIVVKLCEGDVQLRGIPQTLQYYGYVAILIE